MKPGSILTVGSFLHDLEHIIRWIASENPDAARDLGNRRGDPSPKDAKLRSLRQLVFDFDNHSRERGSDSAPSSNLLVFAVAGLRRLHQGVPSRFTFRFIKEDYLCEIALADS
jgi:hypothetical protein